MTNEGSGCSGWDVRHLEPLSESLTCYHHPTVTRSATTLKILTERGATQASGGQHHGMHDPASQVQAAVLEPEPTPTAVLSHVRLMRGRSARCRASSFAVTSFSPLARDVTRPQMIYRCLHRRRRISLTGPGCRDDAGLARHRTGPMASRLAMGLLPLPELVLA